MSIRCLRNDEAPCPVTIDSLVALNNVLNRIKLKLSGSATTSLDTIEFQRCAIGWNEYSKKFMQRVALMKQHPRIEPVKPEGDQFSVNPAYILDKTRITLFSCKLGVAVLDPVCQLTTHRFEALYEKRNLAAAALNMKKSPPINSQSYSTCCAWTCNIWLDALWSGEQTTELRLRRTVLRLRRKVLLEQWMQICRSCLEQGLLLLPLVNRNLFYLRLLGA